ncbi:MAG: dihydrolipoamide acetyltransferase family protein [bacterium]|nr:dihydrolipoamide acetyltransferase family protein [bacterium]MDE0601714.1 dihydrolipoamide acetyltransferase family protein [bacterium]
MRLVRMPRLGQDMEEGTVVEWAKSVGDEVEEGEILAVIETDKAEVAFESPAGGYLVAVLADAGSTLATGEPIAWIADDPAAKPPSSDSAPASSEKAPRRTGTPTAEAPVRRTPPRPGGRKPVSPLARRRARELGVDLAGVAGTGPGGRVTEGDVMKAHQAAQASSEDSDELSRMRLAIAARMSKSAAVPQFQLVREIILEKPEPPGDGPKVTYTDLLLWAAAGALAERPAVNSSWVEGNPPTVRTHPNVNLGFAVAVADGLIVPVIRDAASMSPERISAERRRLERAARGGRLRPGDLSGGTFTVSNLGGAGVDEFIALLNPPEAGILAVGAVKPRPVVVDGALVAAPTVRLTLTGDHRVFDGMEGARFLQAIADRLQPRT